MKKKILGTVLLSAVVLSNLTGGILVLADDSINASGSVTVVEGEIDPPTVDPGKPGKPGDSKDPEDPNGGVVVPDIPGTHNPGGPGDGFTPGGGGPLSLIGASNLKFGTIKTSTSAIRQAAQAARVWVPSAYDDADKTKPSATATYTEKKVGNYVQFGDVRVEESGYELKANLQDQFKDASNNNTLNGAEIIYSNGVLTHGDGSAAAVPAANFLSTMTLKEGTGPETVVKVDEDTTNTKGKGLYSVEYGQTNDIKDGIVANGSVAKGTENNSVFLRIPATSAKSIKKGSYTATIVWSIEDTIVTP